METDSARDLLSSISAFWPSPADRKGGCAKIYVVARVISVTSSGSLDHKISAAAEVTRLRSWRD